MDATDRRPRLQWTLVASAPADAGAKLMDAVRKYNEENKLKIGRFHAPYARKKGAESVVVGRCLLCAPCRDGQGRKYQYVLNKLNGCMEVFGCGECNKEESRPAAEYFRLDQAVKQLEKERKNIIPTEVAKFCARRDEELQLGGKQIREAVRRRRIKHGAVVKKTRSAMITWTDEWDQLVRERSDPDSGLLAFVHVPRSWCISSWVALVPPFFQQLEILGEVWLVRLSQEISWPR